MLSWSRKAWYCSAFIGPPLEAWSLAISSKTYWPGVKCPLGSSAMVILGPPWRELMMAFIEKASSWPVTIMSWSMATMEPRMRLGAVSAR